MSGPVPPLLLTSLTTYRLSAAGRRARAAAVRALAAEDLRLDHVAALALLDEDAAAPSQARISDRLAKDPGDVVRLVDDLAARGWATRSRDPADRRRSLVATTPEGTDVLARALVLLRSAEEEVLSPLSARDRATLHRLLERLQAPT